MIAMVMVDDAVERVVVAALLLGVRSVLEVEAPFLELSTSRRWTEEVVLRWDWDVDGDLWSLRCYDRGTYQCYPLYNRSNLRVRDPDDDASMMPHRLPPLSLLTGDVSM